ncbi:MAG: hypothetical protein NZ821_06690 [Gloeomargarita sp. SKYB31]|nr:hypothetical protein [Gloeomargarita sp. SKYG98]MCS7226660.1 hypothetical protein [Gloeomargarita sp. SKYB31]
MDAHRQELLTQIHHTLAQLPTSSIARVRNFALAELNRIKSKSQARASQFQNRRHQ